MNKIEKIKQQVKTKLILTTLMVFAISFVSCDDDPETPVDELNLTFNLETEQDQMGDFYGNSMAVHNGMVWSSFGYNDYTHGFTHNWIWNSENGAAWVSASTVGVDGSNGDAREGHTLTSFNNELWIIGGENNNNEWQSDVWNSTDGNTWVKVTDTAPFGTVAYHSAVVFNGKMYVIAGKRTPNATEVWSTLDGENWTQENANAFSGRVSQKAVVFNNAMYVIGGEDTAGNKLNEIWTSTDGINWTLVAKNSSVFTGRTSHTATVYNGKVWIVGGRTTTELFVNDIYYSDNMTDWVKYSGSVPIDPLVQHQTLLYNNSLWVFGGRTGNADRTGKIWSFKVD